MKLLSTLSFNLNNTDFISEKYRTEYAFEVEGKHYFEIRFLESRINGIPQTSVHLKTDTYDILLPGTGEHDIQTAVRIFQEVYLSLLPKSFTVLPFPSIYPELSLN